MTASTVRNDASRENWPIEALPQEDPKECVGNDINHVLHCKMLIINHIN